MKRAVVLCPGRGSYAKESLSSLKGITSPALDVFDAYRSAQGRPTVREMDSAPGFTSKLHIRGENASALTAGVSLADLDQVDTNAYNIVGVIGNSMGWYTALGYAGALSLEATAELIETMGQYQVGNIVGGQIVYPCVADDWTVDPARVDAIDSAVAQVPDLFWSIRLGGQAVLGGTDSALKRAAEILPEVSMGTHTFPLRLPLHSAFHTPLMEETAERARVELAHLPWTAPRIPMIDGLGHVHSPYSASPERLRNYTLGPQVTDTFDLTLAIRTALRTWAPDVVILPGPGSNLGSAVAQTMITERWAEIGSREAFIKRQNDDPILLSMRWPDQRERVVRA